MNAINYVANVNIDPIHLESFGLESDEPKFGHLIRHLLRPQRKLSTEDGDKRSIDQALFYLDETLASE